MLRHQYRCGCTALQVQQRACWSFAVQLNGKTDIWLNIFSFPIQFGIILPLACCHLLFIDAVVVVVVAVVSVTLHTFQLAPVSQGKERKTEMIPRISLRFYFADFHTTRNIRDCGINSSCALFVCAGYWLLLVFVRVSVGQCGVVTCCALNWILYYLNDVNHS